ncbi:unnamed protein product [Phytomonas sp. Hart1]|nr:unnamed protein product [Phytomonas sp. Hart1]|eukprot:CCW70975.1 unnamed protein product [Phytomonas sp. isolate Hart1]
MSRYTPTSEASARFIQTHLEMDLEELAAAGPDASPLRPVLPKSSPLEGEVLGEDISVIQRAPTRTEEKFMILQVQNIVDISLSREQQLRGILEAIDPGGSQVEGIGYTSAATTAPEGAKEDENEDDDKENTAALVDATLKMSEAINDARRGGGGGRNGRYRLLRLILTDGFTRVLAVEKKAGKNAGINQLSSSPPPLFPEGVALGAKIKILLDWKKEVPLQTRGILGLHPEKTIYLGGRVIALELFWATYAREQLYALTGRPSLSTSLSPSSPALSHITAVEPNPQQPPTSLSSSLPIPPISSSLSAAIPSPSQMISSSLPLCQPLTRWNSRNDPHAPFPTRAVITAVVSDLLINEYSTTNKNERVRRRGNGSERENPKTRCAYSLLVSLAPPPLREKSQRRENENEENRSELTVEGEGEAGGLTVDLGHSCLRELVGMTAEDFRQLSLSREASDLTRMNNIIDGIGARLEQLGEALFVLLQGPSEQTPMVIEIQPLKECH